MNTRLRQVTLWGIIIATLFINGLRFFKIAEVPRGFHVDESSSSLTLECLATEGIDCHGVPYPFFSDVGFGTPKPFTYIYPGIAWTKIFGFSIPGFRSYSVAWTIFGLAGLFFLARAFWGTSYAWWVVLVASISPWTWNISRIAFEPMLAPSLLCWGLFFLFRPARWHNMVLAGVILSLSMHSYPATRVHLPLMLAPLLAYRFWRKSFSWRTAGIFLTVLILTTIPLLVKVAHAPYMTMRFKEIGIFARDYLSSIGKTSSVKDLLTVFFQNFAIHFRPDFLFARGDANMTYSTRWCGIFSWMDIAALLTGVIMIFLRISRWKCHGQALTPGNTFIAWLIVNYLLGIVPAALTWDEIPDSLRMIGSWPFLMLLTGYVFWRLGNTIAPAGILCLTLTMTFAFGYLNHYFTKYPEASSNMFFSWVRKDAEACRNDTDWFKFLIRHHRHNLQTRFYLITYHGDSCTGSQEKVRAAFRIMGNPLPDD